MVTEDLGQLLVDKQIVSEPALQKAAQQQKSTGGAITACLVKIGALTEEQLLEFLSQHFRVPAVDLRTLEPDPTVVRLLPAEVATKFLAMPLSRVGRRLKVAMAQPSNIFAIDDIKFITGFEVEPVVATEGAIKKQLDRAYDSASTMADVMKGIEEDLEVVEAEEEEADSAGLSLADEAPIVKLVNSLIADAVRKGASDIHIEPYEKSLRVRFRIDGVLYEMMAPPFKFKAAILSRLKIMAELDIAERRVPQDGRIKIKVLNRTIDLRVSTLPTIFGEKIVMRILDKTNLNIDLEKLGFEPRSMEQLLKAICNPYGMVLVTGPTGSGKTTTLYSALSRINTPEVNIMTAEDPVEYNLDGINQVPIHEGIGLTFAGRPQGVPAAGPQHHHGRRDPRPRHRLDRHQGGAHRPPGALHPAHQRRAQRHRPPHRHGHRAVPGRLVGQPHPRPAAGAPGLRQLPHAGAAAPRGAARAGAERRGGGELRVHGGQGLRRVQRTPGTAAGRASTR